MERIKIYSLIPPAKSDRVILVPNPVLDEDDIEEQLYKWLDSDGKNIENFLMNKITDSSIERFCSEFPKTADWIACIILDKKDEFEMNENFSVNKILDNLKALNELEISDELHVFNEDIDTRYPWLQEAYWEIKTLEYTRK